MTPDIFISYATLDRAAALSLADLLRGEGHIVWIDTESIDGASSWRQEIVGALLECKVVLVILSQSSLASPNVLKELTIAADEHKKILPVDLEQLPLTPQFRYHLAGLQHIRFEQPDKIVKAAAKLAGKDEATERVVIHSSATHDKFIHVAVLPFDDLSPQHDNEWFADGMMDELISTLSALKELRVPSRSDVIYYKTHRQKMREISSDLGVRYLIEGAVRKAGDKIRINATLFDSYENQQLWSNKYDGTFDDIFHFQESVSTSITDALKLKLTPIEAEKVRERPTENAEAYELYLKGLEFHRHITREGYEKALDLYEEAIKLDPKFADAYIAMADASATYYREYSREPKWIRRAEENLAKAETITGETARTLWAKGEIAWQNGKLDEARTILLRAVEIDPTNAQLYNMLGNIYVKLNMFDEASRTFEQCVSLVPSQLAFANYLVVLGQLDDFAKLKAVALEAVEVTRKYIAHVPDNHQAHFNLVYALFSAGQTEEALREAQLLVLRDNLDGMTLYNLGTVFVTLGEIDLALKTIRKSVTNGFRQIEIFKKLELEEPIHKEQLKNIIEDLEQIIKKEQMQ